uniref:Peptide-methionine (R)-S-oxide reductase n=1 Tax=Octactis speculum TaxID=3111310 RepID=A0A7S2DMD8_9STRA|mmetsp:Transcript_51056/g.69543  ORF Transcript_51056/g.69543 Transcript_51056/m.69543 type:complete len:169 (+) Transcript_51056:16-522(+)
MGMAASRSRSYGGLAARIRGDESLMSVKSHGTTEKPPQANLRWGVDPQKADKICCFNRHYAEHSGYWEKTNFLSEIDTAGGEMTFYDTVSGKPLFVAPRGRSWDDFLNESRAHGWPSFRDEEVIENDVRVLDNGEAVSLCGTHLGHNLPDRTGNRYCINLVSVAGVGK